MPPHRGSFDVAIMISCSAIVFGVVSCDSVFKNFKKNVTMHEKIRYNFF